MDLSLDEEWSLFQQDKTIESITDKNKNNVEKDIPKCSDIYISTQTKIGHLNKEIDLNLLFWKIPIIPYYMQKKV